jgi:hypothetical protein
MLATNLSKVLYFWYQNEGAEYMENIIYYNIKDEPFGIYGLYNPKEEDVFKRMPDDVAKATSKDVEFHAKETAGGRIRFTTDSPYVAIKAEMPYVANFPHMPVTGTSGFDLYVHEGGKDVYKGTFMPPSDMKNGYESVIHFSDRKTRNITIHFPLYNHVNKVFAGLQKGSFLGSGHRYKYEKPIVYYGSSITQGGCASRPGNCYTNIISATLDCDHINLGFSGSAKAEDPIAEYIASLDFAIFVYDYDHNAPTCEYLEATHERMFLRIREKQPNKPIILMSRPDFDASKESSILRRNIIRKTYTNALARGDKNTYFIDGEKLFMEKYRDACTVDNCHPNDAGFVRMAEVVSSVVEMLLHQF